MFPNKPALSDHDILMTMIISIFPIKNTTFSLIGLLRNEPITVLFKVLNTRTEIKDQGRIPA